MSHVLGWTMFGCAVILLLGSVGAGAVTYERAYRDRIYPGVRIGSITVGGFTKAEATARVQASVDAFLGQGIPFALDGKVATIGAVISAPQDPDLTYEIIGVDVAALVEQAFTVGRDGTFTAAWSDRVRGAVGDDRVIPLSATVDEARLARALAESFREQLPPVESPRIRPVTREGRTTVAVTEGKPGRRFDAAVVAAVTRERIGTLDPAPVVIAAATVDPPYRMADVEAVLPAVDAAIARAPIQLTHGDRRFPIDATALAGLFTIGSGPVPAIDAAAFDVFLAPIVRELEQAPEDARFSFDPATKRVREFRPAREGVRIDREALRAALADAAFGVAPPVVPIPVDTATPTIALADTNEFGIRDLLGVGRTKFTGSPVNRRHNIAIGAGLLNGVLIAPGEELSTVAAVSPFTAATGYRPELVIKGSKTIPEFGGGLCQVSTTLFRTVLAAGLPVTERTNHAYRVPYYEPPIGMDATIYGPKPDFKFRNDTGHHLLIRTRVIGDILEYEFWGTKDGRIAATSEPEVFNFVSPPPMKTIETTDLPPGKKKCTERAHTGVDARFTYTVTHADGRKEERVFKSHYRPWQAVCLVGVKPEASEPTVAPGDPSAPPVPPSTPSTELPIGGAN